MNLPCVKLFADSSAVVEMLTDDEAGRLLKSLLRYINDQEPILSGNERFVYAMLKAQVDRDAASYQAYLEKQRENGLKGGRPKKAVGSAENPNNPAVSKETQKSLEIEVDNDIEKDNDIDTDKRKAKRRFTPPTREQVAEYIAEKGYRVDADRWMAYYESNGWRVGKNPMKDWKAAVRTWASNDVDKPRPAPARQVIAQQYEQRSYAGEEEINDLIDWLKEDREAGA
jgi:hypothetical protein